MFHWLRSCDCAISKISKAVWKVPCNCFIEGSCCHVLPSWSARAVRLCTHPCYHSLWSSVATLCILLACTVDDFIEKCVCMCSHSLWNSVVILCILPACTADDFIEKCVYVLPLLVKQLSDSVLSVFYLLAQRMTSSRNVWVCVATPCEVAWWFCVFYLLAQRMTSSRCGCVLPFLMK